MPTSNPRFGQVSIASSTSIPTKTQPSFPFSTLTFLPGTYDVILLLDNREQRSGDRAFFPEALRARGIAHESRTLEIGDVAWIAREKGVDPDEQKEVVLDSILERKTLDDLVGSIKDGRFKEQKVCYN